MTVAGAISRYRFLAIALAGSAALHAAVMVNVPTKREPIAEPDGPEYSATLDPAAQAVEPTPAPVPKPAAHPRPRARRVAPVIAPELLSPLGEEVIAAAPLEDLVPEPQLIAPAPKPEVVAMAQPAVPVPALEAPKFKSEVLPSELSITYQLTSAMADGRAVYNWSRDGDEYRITGEAEAIGFFTLFLEGRVLQETRGKITPQGLRPERFTERKPSMASEGLEFDWDGGKVTFDRNNEKKTDALGGNIVDWLSMLFQTAANPPPASGEYSLDVLTQRKLYRFKLKVLGEEEIDIPLGRVRTVHLRHVDPKDETEVVDVWLGIDQSYLPVKLRYPVAKNRLMVDQVATRVSVH
jgi:uncharacterized protein DUF3108